MMQHHQQKLTCRQNPYLTPTMLHQRRVLGIAHPQRCRIPQRAKLLVRDIDTPQKTHQSHNITQIQRTRLNNTLQMYHQRNHPNITNLQTYRLMKHTTARIIMLCLKNWDAVQNQRVAALGTRPYHPRLIHRLISCPVPSSRDALQGWSIWSRSTSY